MAPSLTDRSLTLKVFRDQQLPHVTHHPKKNGQSNLDLGKSRCGTMRRSIHCVPWLISFTQAQISVPTGYTPGQNL